MEDRVGQEVAVARAARRAARRAPVGVEVGQAAPSTPNAGQHRVAGAPRVVVSSQAMPTWSASTRRRLTPALARPRRRPRPARPGTPRPARCRRSSSCTTSTPPARRPVGQHGGVPVGAPGDRAQPVGAVVDGVHAGHHGEQHLRGADVAGRLLPADVLLAGLQREPVGGVAVGVDATRRPGGRAAAAAGPRAPPGSRRAGRRSPAARRSAGWCRPRCRRRSRRARASRVSASRSAATTTSAPRACAALDDGAEVAHRAGGARVLQEHAEALASAARRSRSRLDELDAERLGPGGAAPRWSAAARRRRRRTRRLLPWPARRASVIASAAAVPSSSSEAFGDGSPVRSATMVWKLSSASSRPWEISGW